MNEEFEKWFASPDCPPSSNIKVIMEAAWNAATAAATKRCLRILRETDFGRYTEIGERIAAAIREGER